MLPPKPDALLTDILHMGNWYGAKSAATTGFGQAWTDAACLRPLCGRELSDYEWTAIKPMLPNKPRGVRQARINPHLAAR
jgi:hypothetical protein